MEFDESNTPFLRLPPPHSDIVLATIRDDDGPALVSMLNHPAVYVYLAGPPFPYTQTHWDAKFNRLSSEAETALAEFREVKASSRQWISKALLTVIRELDPQTGESKCIGDFKIERSGFVEIQHPEERKMMKDKNDKLGAGDPNIVWEIGFSLSPEVHGRGIMTAALGTLTENFLIPYMNVCRMTGGYLAHNTASQKVFEKNGWVFDKFEPDSVELSESTTGVKGKKFGLMVMKWNRTQGPP